MQQRIIRRRAWTLAVGVSLLTLVALTGSGVASALGAHHLTTTRVRLSDERTVSRWAYPQTAAIVRARPTDAAPRVGRLRFLTPDGLGQAQIYEALEEVRIAGTGARWVEVSVPGRPNGTVGWVPAPALSPFHVVYGELVVNRRTLRATLYGRTGRVLWSAPVGVGRPSLPTPAGHFYVLEKLRAIGGPFYGPYALATSAYAPTLSDWPGGGVVGIHGTDAPQLIPGYPSHGCVRMRNADITALWHRIALGTPIDITG